MILWAVLSTVLAVGLIFILLMYRRQVKNTCRQLGFLKENQTNLRLTVMVPFKQFEKLVDSINQVLDMSQEIKNNARKNEEHLKETITNLSHDIRTPLTSLDGYFQLLAQSDSEEEQRHYIEVIQSRISSLKDILEELFTYTKLQNEQYELKMETVDFGKCVYDTVFSFYDEFQTKGLEPEIDFCEGHFSILGNAEAVRRALQNIIKNALEHGKKEITLNLYKDKNEIVFRCSNDVENPSEVDIHEVFSRFYKADSARSNISTGLGLSIAKELIERMQGTIAAELEMDCFGIEIRFLVQ